MSDKKTNDNEICMLCGRWKEEESLVCQKHFKEWRAEWEKDEKVAIVPWTFQKAKICCASIDKQLEKEKRTFDEFQRIIKEDAYKKVDMALMGIKVADFSDMVEIKRQKLWKEKNGDKLYGQLKRLEVQAKMLPEFTQELKSKIDKYDEEEKQEEE